MLFLCSYWLPPVSLPASARVFTGFRPWLYQLTPMINLTGDGPNPGNTHSHQTTEQTRNQLVIETAQSLPGILPGIEPSRYRQFFKYESKSDIFS